MEPKEFGEYLRDLRKRRGLTIRKLDNLSTVSHSYISQMERGERGIPSPEILKKLAEPLGVSYEQLMEKAGYVAREKFINNLQGAFERLHYERQAIETLLRERPTEVIELEKKYRQHLNGKALNVESFLSEKTVSGAKRHEEWADELWDELYNLAQRYLELTYILQFMDVTIKGQRLTRDERQRILKMLELMLPLYFE